VVYGDSAYGTGAHLAWLGQQGSRRWSRPSSRPHQAAGSPRTSSASTSRPAPSPARPGWRWRSARPTVVVDGPGSAWRAASARCARGAL